MAYARPITAARPLPGPLPSLVSHQARASRSPAVCSATVPSLTASAGARHAAAAEPDIDGRPARRPSTRGPGRGAERLGGLRRVDGRADGGAAGQSRRGGRACAGDDLVRYQHIAGPGVDHGLRLADRGAGQAGGARRQLAERERGRAVAPSRAGGSSSACRGTIARRRRRSPRRRPCPRRARATGGPMRPSPGIYPARRPGYRHRLRCHRNHATTARARSKRPVTTPASASAARPPVAPGPAHRPARSAAAGGGLDRPGRAFMACCSTSRS